MTKKKNRQDEEQQFDPTKPKSRSKARFTQKAVKQSIKQQKKKQHQKHMIYNNLRAQDRKVQEQKYKQNLISKKMQEQRRSYMRLVYDEQMDSQLAEIDEESVQRRDENEIIREIKEILQKEEISLNKHHLSASAQNQFYKLQRLTEELSEKNKQGREKKDVDMDIVNEQYEKMQINQGIHIGDEIIKDGQSLFGKSEIEMVDKRTVLQKISSLEMIYY